ncbi:hypothetical protein ACFQX6_67025 [Streptosporangium lutulentum]
MLAPTELAQLLNATVTIEEAAGDDANPTNPVLQPGAPFGLETQLFDPATDERLLQSITKQLGHVQARRGLDLSAQRLRGIAERLSITELPGPFSFTQEDQASIAAAVPEYISGLLNAPDKDWHQDLTDLHALIDNLAEASQITPPRRQELQRVIAARLCAWDAALGQLQAAQPARRSLPSRAYRDGVPLVRHLHVEDPTGRFSPPYGTRSTCLPCWAPPTTPTPDGDKPMTCLISRAPAPETGGTPWALACGTRRTWSPTSEPTTSPRPRRLVGHRPDTATSQPTGPPATPPAPQSSTTPQPSI